MNTKELGVIIVLTATAIALNPIKIPTVFWPGQYFRIWEIPLIIVFLLFGLKIAISATTLYAAAHVTILSAAVGPIAFPWVIVLMLTMFLGLSIYYKSYRKAKEETPPPKKPIFYFTLTGALTRIAIMPFVDLAVYKFLLPLLAGNVFSDTYIIGLVPAIIFFNLITPLYSIPIAYKISRTISKNFNIGHLI